MIQGQRLVCIAIDFLCERTGHKQGKLRWDLRRLIKCGYIGKGVLESTRGQTLSFACVISPDCLTTTLPVRANGIEEIPVRHHLEPEPQAEPDTTQLDLGIKNLHPHNKTLSSSAEDLSEYDCPYPDAPAVEPKKEESQKNLPVVAEGRKPVGNLGNVLTKLAKMGWSLEDNHRKSCGRLTGAEYDALLEGEKLDDDDPPMD